VTGNWTTSADLKAQLARLWERGDLLRDAVIGNSRFPLRLTFKTPASSDITERFESVRDWAAALTRAPVRLEWQQVNHRVQGLQRVPLAAWVDSIEDALTWLGKRSEWQRFLTLIDITRNGNPALIPWLEKRPLLALEKADDWTRLMSVVGWLMKNPRPAIYLRQVDLPGIHSKFIEMHRSTLIELFNLALPVDAIDASKTGVVQFSARYGFLEKPTHIRFRILDPRMQVISGTSCADILLDVENFSALTLNICRVFITENETNFLTLPTMPETMVIFGAGYGWDNLAKAHWLRKCVIHYWGDIDTHGFVILNQLRGSFDHVGSFLMDRTTLITHKEFWGVEEKPSHADLQRLTTNEASLYDDLRSSRLKHHLRLEQEHVGFDWMTTQIEQLLS